MGPKKDANRFKITCLECGVEMNNDYRTKHNRLFHAKILKQHKVIRWETLNAPKNPFEARPAKVPRTDEVSSTSAVTEEIPSTLTTADNTNDMVPVSDSIPTVNKCLLSISANTEKPVHLFSIEARGKQSTASQKPIVVGEEPCQPRDPKLYLQGGAKSKRSFRPSWFDHNDWKNWLHYDLEKNAAFCFTCIKAVEKNLISSNNLEKAFISAGYKNWSDAATSGRGFDKHNRSDAHREAHQRLYTIPQTCEDIGEQISQAHAEEKSANRQALLKILSNIRFLARQALPLRGDGNGTDSNFNQLYLLQEDDHPILKQWRIDRKTDKYVHNTIQNEMMKVMALQVLREVAQNIQSADFYSMMGDEATDVSNVSQLVICLRWVDCDLVAHDEFIGLKEMPCTNADSIVNALKDVLLRMNVRLNKCRGQCYDGCSTMSGSKNGVVVQIKKEEKRALYTHCYCHSLNLAIGDTMRNCDLLQRTLDNTFELTKLVKKSPKRDSKLKEIQASFANENLDDNVENESKPSISMFCPTRWTVRGKCLEGIINNFDELQRLWEWAAENTTDVKMKGRIRGIAIYSNTFSYCFGIHLSATILKNSDNLSKALQGTQVSAIDAQGIAGSTVKALNSLRTVQNFNLFYEKVKKFARDHGVDEPSLPRNRQARVVIENFFSKTKSAAPKNPEEEYRRIYYQGIELVVAFIKERFDQEDFKMYATCEQLLVKAANNENFEDELQNFTQFYGSDFDPSVLETQLNTLPFCFSPNVGNMETFRDVLKQVKAFSKGHKLVVSEVVKLLKLIMVMPATNAVSERSFSAMRRLYTYTRTNMSQNRLNNMMVLHIHKEKTDALNLLSVANEFVTESEHRLNLFGKFTELDSRRKNVPVKSRGVQVNLI